MKKQIVYPKFIPRLFATTIDLFLISIISPFIMPILTKTIYNYAFKEYILKVQEGANMELTPANIFYTPEFFEYISSTNKLGIFLTCVGIIYFINFTFLGAYFISFWKYTSATPGKMIMGMKIVDAETFEKPHTSQFVKRFFGYLTALFGIWSILFTTQRQALHDKIASTVVIKS